MDPMALHALGEIIGPAAAMLILAIVPISLVYMSKHFKLKTRELELESQLHGREAEARLRVLETRQAALEGAIGSLVNTLTAGAAMQVPQPLLQPPPQLREVERETNVLPLEAPRDRR